MLGVGQVCLARDPQDRHGAAHYLCVCQTLKNIYFKSDGDLKDHITNDIHYILLQVIFCMHKEVLHLMKKKNRYTFTVMDYTVFHHLTLQI